VDETSFHYFGSDNPVRVGDRILVRSLFGRAKLATIVYIPGQCKPDHDLGNDQWAYKFDDGGGIWAAGYSPKQYPSPSKRIRFVSRPGQEANEVMQAYQIPLEEPKGQPGRDFLAFIGCGTLIAIAIVLLLTLGMWLFGWR
jgi:hypothetical protein